MKNSTKVIALIALLIVGGAIGYFIDEYQKQYDAKDEEIRALQELVQEIQEKNEEESETQETDDQENEEDEEQDENDNEDEQEEAETETGDTNETEDIYEPFIIADPSASGYEDFPAYDTGFVSEEDLEGGSAPHIIWTNEREEAVNQVFKLLGTISTDVERIDVIRDGDMSPFTLQKYTPGGKNFEYNMNPQFGNMDTGNNRYLIRGYADERLYELIVEVEYKDAPSIEELDDAFKANS